MTFDITSGPKVTSGLSKINETWTIWVSIDEKSYREYVFDKPEVATGPEVMSKVMILSPKIVLEQVQYVKCLHRKTQGFYT